MWGGVPDVINPAKFFENRPRVFELADPEIWHFPLTLLVVLTTLSHYRVRCDRYWGVQIPGSTYYMLHRAYAAESWPYIGLHE